MPIIILAAIIAVGGLAGLTQVQVQSHFQKMFPDDNATMGDMIWIEDNLGAVGDLEIVFTV